MEREEGGLDRVEAVAEGKRLRARGRSSVLLGCSWVPAVCVYECVFIHVHGSVCVYSWGMEEDESSAQPFEIDSPGRGPISQVQTELKPHFNSLLSNLSIFLIRCF